MRISVITAVKNGARHIERCLHSVRGQSFPAFEHIVIDSCSSDGTSEIVRRNMYAGLRHFIRNDSGIADGWNRGLNLASGDVVAILNADDYYRSDALGLTVETLARRPEAGVTYGDTLFVNQAGVVSSCHRGVWSPGNLFRGIGFMHPSCFVRREVYGAVGVFDTSWRYAMDCDWLIRAFRQRVVFAKSPARVYMSSGGLSDTRWRDARAEYLAILRHHYPKRYCMHAAAVLYVALESVLKRVRRVNAS